MDSAREKPSHTIFSRSRSGTSPDFVNGEPTQASRPRRRRRATVIVHWLSHFLSLLWLAPIAALLYLNFSHHVIGASVWCPNGKCNAESTGDNAIQRASQFDRQDHDVNGALQFVAKALEVWFFFCATSLIFDLGMMFARYGGGLPVGYILTHLEFGDIRYLINPLLWTTPVPHRNAPSEKRVKMVLLYLFAITTACLTILANLMGPAAAVLVLPTLQWVETKHKWDQTFNGTAAAEYPSYLPGCTDEQLNAANYSCTSDIYGSALDELAAFAFATTQQSTENGGTTILAPSQEQSVQLLLNLSDAKSNVIWVPNRQVLRSLSYDFQRSRGYLTEADPPEYPEKIYNNSLQTLLQREGPAIGLSADCYIGAVQLYTLDEMRELRCYSGWFGDDVNQNYTKCYRYGEGFSPANIGAGFFLENLDPNVSDLNTSVSHIFSDKATYYNDTTDFGSGIKDCLQDVNSTDCNWEQIFDHGLPEEFRNMSRNVGLVSYQIPGSNGSNSRLWCDHVAYLGFPTYSVDTSPNSNQQNLVTIDKLPPNPNNTNPAILNPTWLLVAWSTDLNTALDGGRAIVKRLSDSLTAIFSDDASDSSTEFNLNVFLLLHLYSLAHSLSIIPYYNETAPADPNSKEAKLAEKDPDHPIFRTYGRIHVWAYGIGGRTAKLGVVVAIIGCVCVIARFFIGIATGIQDRSTVELLAAAFEHHHQGEFTGLEEEAHMAKVRYAVVEDGGKHRFRLDRLARYRPMASAATTT